MLQLLESWSRCWRELGAEECGDDVCASLLLAYAEPQRKYHTLQHLGECLELLESVRASAQRPAEVEAGLWFHDAVYDVEARDNEALSAEWARRALLAGAVPAAARSRVCALVMVTRHHAEPDDADQQLLIDIDLSILGSTPARFAEYEAQIREEYSFVPEALFRQKRRSILRSFLDRERIFGTAHFHGQREARARENLAHALESSLA